MSEARPWRAGSVRPKQTSRNSKLETRNSKESGVEPVAYARLDAWRLADELARDLFHVTRGLSSKDNWLRSQIMRAAISVPANIAEGYTRSSNREFAQFLSIARGSLAEVEYYIHFLTETDEIDKAMATHLRELSRRAGQTLYGLMRSARPDTKSSDTARRYLKEDTADYDA